MRKYQKIELVKPRERLAGNVQHNLFNNERKHDCYRNRAINRY